MPPLTDEEKKAEFARVGAMMKDTEKDFTDEQKTTYEGFCHCKAIQYTVRLPTLTGENALPIMNCSCSICNSKGYLLAYPLREHVKFIQGKDHMASYRFATKKLNHRFCPTCGTALFADPEGSRADRGDVLSVNVRTLRGVDVDQLKLMKFNGRDAARTEYNEETC